MNIPKPIRLLGARIHPVQATTVLAYVAERIQARKKALLFPINIHILLELADHPTLKREYEKNARIIFSDGVPLVWLSRLMGTPLAERVSGTDVVERILLTQNRVFLLGSSQSVLTRMKQKYPSICGTYSPPYAKQWTEEEHARILAHIHKASPRILLAGVGPMKQEKWILAYFKKTPAYIGIPVGSAFDILSGAKPRAPMIMQNIGLEWLWRVMLEPKRLFLRYIKDMVRLTKLIILYQ
jgi:N-acetylglucosaminyldiphosphoundecaprenol N-acetyl-beta-D-mannosaminyltransferase